MDQPQQSIQLLILQQTTNVRSLTKYIKYHLLSVSPVNVEAVAWSVDIAVLSAAAGHASALSSGTEIQLGDGDAAAIELLLLATVAISNLPLGHQEDQYWAREIGKYYK